jgi:hypothetical protein
MLHFTAAHKIAAVITSVVIAGGIGGAVARAGDRLIVAFEVPLAEEEHER